jgi:acetyl-CoA carboxylase biotin carboxylase subunit
VFRKVLVANRGEIARRVLRTCRELGVATVAVYSDVDADEPHVTEADEAVRLGPAPATESYLDVDAILDAVRRTGADAVHPGYGFLAENAAFAEAVAAADATFVGPSPEVMRLMGDKAAAKQHLEDAGVPVVPGLYAQDLGDEDVLAGADDVGYPMLIKAVAGGGGKGMRTVHHREEFADALAAARREARAAFGDDRVILERLVSRPRHVEVQVFGDAHGHVIHLLERECSVQRRHQKVVEETPSPALDPQLRERMGSAAVTAARTVGYEGAGTVEFLLAGDTLETDEPEFFFLEMNTRLQVEHPVTELVTGLDLVACQLRVAAGERLTIEQDDVAADGHALEVRLYAEDPVSHLPQTGPVRRLDVPRAGDVRVDAGVVQGSRVERFYDPMLAKLVVHAPDRATSCERMAWLLRHTIVHGVVTNLELLTAIVEHEAFRAGALTTSFLDDHLGDWEPSPTPTTALVAAAVALQDAAERTRPAGDPHSPWDTLGPFRPGLVGGWRLRLVDGDTTHDLSVAGRAGAYRVRQADEDLHVRVTTLDEATGTVHLEVDGREEPTRVSVIEDGDGPTVVWVHAEGTTRRLEVEPAVRHAASGATLGGAAFTSPMPGAVLAVNVGEGDHVGAGTTLLVVEAMKMEHPVDAPSAGRVLAVHVAVGDGVDAGTSLLEFEPDEE